MSALRSLVIGCLVTFAHCRALVQVATLHRHGARTEPIVTPTELNWLQCVLSPVGAQMSVWLGRHLRAQYAPYLFVDGTPWLPEAYLPTNILSRSTDYERTIRTAVGVVRGLFNANNRSNTTMLPYVHHDVLDVDVELCYMYSWPSAMSNPNLMANMYKACEGITRSLFTDANLTDIARAIGFDPAECLKNVALCALAAEDITTCRLSNNAVVSEVLLRALPALKQVQAISNRYLYVFDPSERPYWGHVGPYAQVLVDSVMESFQQAKQWVSGPAPQRGASPPRMLHFSAHDVTIVGLFSALGVVNGTTSDLTLMVPTFASVVALELWDDGNVSIRYWTCEQRFGSGWPYSLYDVSLNCLAASGSAYRATECPAEDIQRAAAKLVPLPGTGTPTSPTHPWCYSSKQTLEEIGCSPTSVTPPTNPACLSYRTSCAAIACAAPDLVLDEATGTCLPTSLRAPPLTLPPWRIIGVVMSSLLIGLVGGIGLSAIYDEHRQRVPPLSAATQPLVQSTLHKEEVEAAL